MRRTPALSPKKAAQRCSIEKPITPEYVTRKQAASLLQCSDQLISKFIKVGKLRGFRLGTHAVRVKKSDLDALMQEWSTPGAQEVCQ